ncbi:MAG: PorV/PorQ family protein [bacterium]|nr:PorV/PorQ family protein [bacterium]MDD5353596.1 PorV/PorQ family protein [bacterium]MDD5755868.1 PorV/PorQ family protein [bacterium]
MTRKRISILIRAIEITLAFLTTMPSYTGASGTGTTGAQFLRLGAGARPVAMGNAFTAIADDANGPQYNAAGIAWAKHKEAIASYIDYLEGISYGYVGYIHPLPNGSTLGLALAYLDSGSIDQTDLAGSAIGTFSSTQSLLLMTYARTLGSKMSWGSNLKVFQQKIEQEKANGYAMDLGVIYKFWPRFSTGVNVQNLGPGVKFVQETDPLPLTIKAGAAYIFVADTLTLSADVKYQPKEDSKISENVGLEYWINQNLAVRAGYDTANISDIDNFNGITAGLGFQIAGFNLHYAWMPYGILGDTHRISVGYKW